MSDDGRSRDAGRVRRLGPEDAPGLVALWRDTWTATYGPSLGTPVLAAMLRSLDDGVAAMLPGRGERGYGLVLDSRILGSVVLAERGDTAYLWGLYVHPDHQRCGAGSRLLAAAVGDIRSAERVEVRVLATSPWAVAFYRAHGFAEAGTEETEVMSGVRTFAAVLAADVDRLREDMLPWR